MRSTSTQVFQLLAWYAFTYCLFAGALLTADAVSVALRYQKTGQNEFVLYSLGWNQRDDGGTCRSDADWVWKYPNLGL
jgi:hypothetical protein